MYISHANTYLYVYILSCPRVWGYIYIYMCACVYIYIYQRRDVACPRVWVYKYTCICTYMYLGAPRRATRGCGCVPCVFVNAYINIYDIYESTMYISRRAKRSNPRLQTWYIYTTCICKCTYVYLICIYMNLSWIYLGAPRGAPRGCGYSGDAWYAI